MTTVHVSIRGRVQGVGYRAWTADEARRRGLAGWVRNRRDGSVEAVFSGAGDVVADMLAACRRGPSLARVEAVEASPAGDDVLDLRAAGEPFSLLPTL
ncbi:MAG: acylphosphatase [Xanthobacteraceae bacterium]|nr:acylphosphatase [Xanthobacteraceae bacterium]